MNEDASIGDQAPASYHGMDRFACRERVVEELRALGLLEKIEDQMVPIGRAQRSRAIIEYRLSDQWFMRMQPLAKDALEVGERMGLRMYPQRWEAIYRQWLVNTRDWCISRQIWWGHRIPAWYHIVSGEILVDVETPAAVLAAPAQWRQDEDVLDTWFSSALWPYSTLGWPEEGVDLRRDYPTSLLITAKDIIYFWVARMVMTGVHFMDAVPFHKVYFNPVICDASGETMSKSKGNGIDPLHVMDGATAKQLEEPVLEARPPNMPEMLERLKKSYPHGLKPAGADALRLTLLSLNSQAQQVQLGLDKFEEVGQRFVTKLWNACKFVISGLTDAAGDALEAQPALEDRWILGQLDFCIKRVREAFEVFQISEALQALQQFFWDDFCDWYIELVKPRLRGESVAEKRRAQHTEAEVLCALLRLYQPVVPFITEELWQHLHQSLTATGLIKLLPQELHGANLCALAPYPKESGWYDARLTESFGLLQNAVRAVRNIRAASGIGAAAELAVLARAGDARIREVLEDGKSLLVSQARLKSFGFCEDKPAKMAVLVLEGCELFVNLAEHLDIGAEITRNKNALKKIEDGIAALRTRLNNPEFVSRAPGHIQEAEHARLRLEEEKRAKIIQNLEELGNE